MATFGKKIAALRKEIEEREPKLKKNCFFLANAVICDYKAGQAYLTR